jgi:hypothetical protein
MGADLRARWGIPRASVLYDRAPARFRRLPPPERRALLARLAREGVLPGDAGGWCEEGGAGGRPLIVRAPRPRSPA